MAYEYSVSGWHYDFTAKVITVTSASSSVTCQNVVDLTRDAEESDIGMSFAKIINAAGKDSLGGAVQVGITVDLLDDWQLKFEDRSGTAFEQVFVTDGNLVGGLSGQPIKVSDFTQVNVLRSAAATLVVSTVTAQGATAEVDTGAIRDAVWSIPTTASAISSGTIGEALTAIPDDVWTNAGTSVLSSITVTGVTASTDNIAIRDAVWGTPISGSSVSAGTMGEALSASHQVLIGRWAMSGNKLFLYHDDGTTVLREFNLYDQLDQPSLTGVVRRDPV